jgi:hypothetical protein
VFQSVVNSQNPTYSRDLDNRERKKEKNNNNKKRFVLFRPSAIIMIIKESEFNSHYLLIKCLLFIVLVEYSNGGNGK